MGDLTLPCMSNLMVRVTLSPPSITPESITATVAVSTELGSLVTEMVLRGISKHIQHYTQ